MKKFSLLIAGALLVPASVFADSADSKLPTPANVYYKDGAVFDFPDSGTKVKLNGAFQGRYRYFDYDGSEHEDKNDFDVRIARMILSGSTLRDDFSFRLENDFVGKKNEDGEKESSLLDAWGQWKFDELAQLRFGQYKVPFSTQYNASSMKLQTISRSIATDKFAVGYSEGAMLHGSSGGAYYALSVDNGSSDGEGQNRNGVDSDVRGAALAALTGGGYDRGSEGDVKNSSVLGWTTGVSGAIESGAYKTDADVLRLGADAGVKVSGFSTIAEVFFRNTDPQAEGAGSETDDMGYFVQGGYFVVPQEWEVVGRISAINLDDEGLANDGVEDKYEYVVGVNRYYLGHNLKVQADVVWEQNKTLDSEFDATDFRAELQLSYVI